MGAAEKETLQIVRAVPRYGASHSQPGKKKQQKKRTEKKCAGASGAVQPESGGNGPIHGFGVGRGA